MPEQVLRVEIDDISRGAVAGMGGGGAVGGGASTEQRTASLKQSRGWQMLLNTMPGPMGQIASGFKAGGIIGGISAGIAAIVAIFRKSIIFSSYFNAFIQVMGAFVDVFLMPFMPFFQLVMAVLMNTLVWFMGAWPDFTGWWENVGQTLKDFFSGPFTDFWTEVGERMKEFFTGDFVQFWTMIKDAITDWWGTEVVPFWKMVGEKIGDFFSDGWKNFLDFWKWVGENMRSFFSTGWKNFVNFWTWVGNEMRSFFSTIGTGFINFWTMVGNAIKNFFTGTIPNFASMVVKWFEDKFGIDIPFFGYQHGTSYVPRTGLAMLHQGERVVPAGQNNFNFFNSFSYSSPTSYIAGVDSLAGFTGSLQQTIRRIGL